MARKKGRVLPFRIPFFRIFYSTTYTILFILCLCILAITPTSLIWTAVQNTAYQYIFMIGGVYVITGLLAIFIYSSRLYTNRIVLAGVGKSYIPIEDGELGKSVRRMIVKQLERSAIAAWESRPRDLVGEVLQAEDQGVLPPETASVGHNDYTVGRIIPVDPARPPWGHVRHAGWSSPSHRDDNKNPDIHFDDVIAELPNLVEARAVSLVPADSTLPPAGGQPVADPVVAELLRRPETMGMRDYMTQLSYLGLINPPEVGQRFVCLYEKVRFCGSPATEKEFEKLMSTFSEILFGMTELNPAIMEQIRMQAGDKASISDQASEAPSDAEDAVHVERPSRTMTPVTARTAPSRTVTPYMQQESPSTDSFSSVVHTTRDEPAEAFHLTDIQSDASSRPRSPSLASIPSDAGSVVRHNAVSAHG